MAKVCIRNVSKSIKKVEILKNISAEFEAGQVYGIVGENGSGKTMLFRVLSGLIVPQSGEITYNGKLVKKINQEIRIGMTLENIGLYPEMTLTDNLQCISGLSGKSDKKKIKEIIERVGLNPKNRKSYGKYSLGMKQRGTMAQALINEPELLLLDEPFNGLDEEGVTRFRKIVKDEAKRGAIVILSSHNIEDIKLLCNVVYRMRAGELCKEVM